jgi:hypothetical protein
VPAVDQLNTNKPNQTKPNQTTKLMYPVLSENQKENNDNMPHEFLDKYEREQEFLSKMNTGDDQK